MPDRFPVWLALAGVVVGALIGAVPTYLGITAQDRREATAFLRDKREAAYAQYIVDEQSLREAEREYLTRATGNDPDRDGVPLPPTPQQLAALAQASKENYDKFLQSAAAVRLVGSDAANSVSVNIEAEHDAAERLITLSVLRLTFRATEDRCWFH